MNPTWRDGRLLPRAAMVRVYAMADGEGGWHVMPGGLTRIAQREQRVVSMQQGGGSQDTWVRTAGPVDTFSMLPAALRADDLSSSAGSFPAGRPRTCSGSAATSNAPTRRCDSRGRR